ncbi:MAG: polysaccharide biosynthesis protein [Candidatus Dadabacteria bacterium]|nr:polysaccharide biosynthesis protein [Candidatus Dadabacteria bacterium]
MLRHVVIGCTEKYYRHKLLIAAAVELPLFTAILLASYWIRLGGLDGSHIRQALILAAFYVPAKFIVFRGYKLYKISFRFFSVYDLVVVLKAALISAAILALVGLLARDFPPMKGYPRSVVFIDFLLTIFVSAGIRFGFRMFYSAGKSEPSGMKVLIAGAGNAGVRLLKELKTANGAAPYIPVAFIDDDPGKLGGIIRGTKVVGSSADMPAIVKELGIEGLIISIPSATSSQINAIVEHARKAGIPHIKIMPGVSDVLSGKVTLGDFKEVTSEDFLGRESVSGEIESIASYIKGKRVMVTGAGGSIGSELCRQVSSFEPALLIMIDVGDTELFFINQEMNEKLHKVKTVSVIADVKDRVAMEAIFDAHSPDVVFHAAAYKHVPLLESTPREAVLNNVEGTKVTALLSVRYGVQKFIFISTDKAVNPTSVMGATKRVSENMLREIRGRTEFVSVRFGNVLDSRGSVIPIFRDQVRRGGPVTVTHPDMTRYFMSIQEAVYLVLQAGSLGKGGEVFVLDMGEPVKIVDLARSIIRFFGLEPDKDVPIVFTGLRPGEKLYEEILTAEEGTTMTTRKKIFVANDGNHFGREYVEDVKKLIRQAEAGAPNETILRMLKHLVPSYKLKLPEPPRVRHLKSTAAGS